MRADGAAFAEGDLFGGHVTRCPGDDPLRSEVELLAVGAQGQPEVGDARDDLAAVGEFGPDRDAGLFGGVDFQKDVGGLEVAVDHRAAVGGPDRVGEGLDQSGGEMGLLGLLACELAEGAAGDVFEREPRDPLVFPAAEHLDDVGVAHAADGLGLEAEAGPVGIL